MRSGKTPTFTERARRGQIVAAATRVIAEAGYAQASIAKIADGIGVAKSVVLYHFATKDDIIAAVVAEVLGTAAAVIGPAVAAAPSAAERLTAYIRANVAFIDGHRVAATALLDIVTSYRSAEGLRLDQAAETSIAPELLALDPESILAEGVRTGEFRPLRTVFVKNALRAALDGAVWELARDPGYDVVGYGEELVTSFDLATRRQA